MTGTPSRRGVGRPSGRCPSRPRPRPTARADRTSLRDSSPDTQRVPGTRTRPSQSAECDLVRGRTDAWHSVRHFLDLLAAPERELVIREPARTSAARSVIRRHAPVRTRLAAATTHAMLAATSASARPAGRAGGRHGRGSIRRRVAPRRAALRLERADLGGESTRVRSCQPSPTTSSPATITAPTTGFGCVVPRPCSASSSARSRKRGFMPLIRRPAVRCPRCVSRPPSSRRGVASASGSACYLAWWTNARSGGRSRSRSRSTHRTRSSFGGCGRPETERPVACGGRP